MNANDARRMVNDYRRSREEEMQSRAAKLRKEVDKSIQSQASVGGIATFIPPTTTIFGLPGKKIPRRGLTKPPACGTIRPWKGRDPKTQHLI